MYADLTPDVIEESRKGIPLYDQRRFEVYPDISKGDWKDKEEGLDEP